MGLEELPITLERVGEARGACSGDRGEGLGELEKPFCVFRFYWSFRGVPYCLASLERLAISTAAASPALEAVVSPVKIISGCRMQRCRW